MNHSTVEPVVSPSEDPLLAETEEPLSSPRCGECCLQGHCPCLSRKLLGLRTLGHHNRLFLVLSDAMERGGKKSVRDIAKHVSTDDIQSVLQESGHGVPLVELASCVNKRNEVPMTDALENVLHDRRSKEDHTARRTSVKPSLPARTIEMEKVPSFLGEFTVPVRKRSMLQRVTTNVQNGVKRLLGKL